MPSDFNLRQNDFLTKRTNLVKHFEDVLNRLLNHEKIDLDQTDLDTAFDVIAMNLFAHSKERKDTAFDGAVDLSAVIRKTRQIEFNGKMWILENRDNYTEPFQARVTDKRITKQGIWIELWIGSDKAEGELSAAFGLID